MEHLTLDSFKEKVCECGLDGSREAGWKFKGSVPAVIDFYADWCGPCKMISPILEELSKEYGQRLIIYKVNTEEEPALAGAFGITSIPSMLFIPLIGQPQMSAGAMPKVALKKLFTDVLGVEELLDTQHLA